MVWHIKTASWSAVFMPKLLTSVTFMKTTPPRFIARDVSGDEWIYELVWNQAGKSHSISK